MYAMEAALDYLDRKYNGPCNYLDSIGFKRLEGQVKD